MTQWSPPPAGPGHDHSATAPPQSTATPPATLTIRVESDSPRLTDLLARSMRRQGFTVATAVRPASTCILLHRADPMPPQLGRVVVAMQPFHLQVRREPALDVDAVLCIGPSAGHKLSHWRLRLRSDDAAFAASAGACFGELGFTMVPVSERPAFIATATLRYGGADPVARAYVAWTMQQLGCEAPQQNKSWDDDDRDIHIDLPAAPAAGLPIRQRIPITIRADTPEVLAAIEPLLHRAGFTRVGFRQLSPADDSRLKLDCGVLHSVGRHPTEVATIVQALDDAGRALGIDWARFPLEVAEPGTEGGGVVIDIPLAAMRSGLLRPWSRLLPGRYQVIIHDDDREAGVALQQDLQAAGFPVHRRRLTTITEGFAVRCGKQIPESLQQLVGGVVDRAMLRCGASTLVIANFAIDGEKIEIEFAAGAHRDGRLKAELANPTRYAVKIISPTHAAGKLLASELESKGFRTVRVEVDSDDDPTWMKFGGARPEVLDLIDTCATQLFGAVTLPRQKVWPASDHDIFIRLPKSVAAVVKPADSPAYRPAAKAPGRMRQAFSALIRDPSPVRGPLVEVTDRTVRIGDIVLEKPPEGYCHPATVAPARLRGFCIDQSVAETLYFAAQALRGRYPAALEGATAASKTWAIFYLAAAMGVGVLRVNLSAQTDVSELVGRFVPDITRPGAFRFQYGPAPLAMLEGCWLVIDETNIASSEILERMNSLLETPYPTLTLTEYDGQKIADVHPQFRVLATWNPSQGYAGREALSPAFLDRFKVRVCPAPSEADYRALGECLVHGSQPEVVINGVRYRGGADLPLLAELAVLIDEFDRFNTALSRFQAGIAAMAERGELRTRGGIAFTRRAFVDVLRETRTHLLATGERKPGRPAVIQAAWQALSFCHLQRLEPEEERPKAVALLAAGGISATAWDLPS